MTTPDPEILDLAVYNGYLDKSERGYRPTQKGLDIVQKVFANTDMTYTRANMSIHDSTDVILVIYQFIKVMVDQGYVEDESE